jgi:uncharacterized membrane protein
MSTITIPSSQSSAIITTTGHELQPSDKLIISSQDNKLQVTVNVVIGANIKSVTLTTHPIATAKELKTHRLNQSLKLGYTPPLKSTSSK